MMLLGNVSAGPKLHPTRLKPAEECRHVSLFCLLPSPLLIGCPLEQLDAFTLGLLANDELIAINQDPLGRQASRTAIRQGVEIWQKPLEDGSVAVGLFNTGGFGETPQSYFQRDDAAPVEFELRAADLGLTGRWNARDTWRQEDIGDATNGPPSSIPEHGMVVLRLAPRQAWARPIPDNEIAVVESGTIGRATDEVSHAPRAFFGICLRNTTPTKRR